MYSGNRLPRELIVQLSDEAGNPTPEENIRVQLTRDAAALKVDLISDSSFYLGFEYNWGSGIKMS